MDQIQAQLLPLGQQKQLGKGAVLFRQGEVAPNIYVVQTGIVKAYYNTYDGKQFIKSFIQAGECIASLSATVEGRPSTFTACCVEGSAVIEVSRQKLMDALAADERLALTLNSLLLKVSAKKERREYELLCLSPEKRYLRFCQTQKALAAKLSQEDVARYLGITPVSLSRIRKRCRQRVKGTGRSQVAPTLDVRTET